MSTIRYIDPPTGVPMVIDGKNAVLTIPDVLYRPFELCGLDPIVDLGQKHLTGKNALPMLYDAIRRCGYLTDGPFDLMAIASRCEMIQEMIQEMTSEPLLRVPSYTYDRMNKAIADIKLPVWGLNKRALMEVYTNLVSWAKYNPNGYFDSN